ncbi:ImmA/IrrE family metallo-endopeptidase [Janthinobacterium sp. 17J80-10]|uniref:ImmA/IrrE family metallo-endopeptidase n=1 Tax=Janthinobacterium sp. 17J80-10 TaxID=2497863 RepID=UPI00100596EF|nr:ImmA/IrrE family metallo-endopeptidase [Janthinobacterium sp. 17J80-10]QAU35151.1 ImmA/IrrE family metallo-endopeptidase [Janthinobacterium sp. 17J80-10]
MNDPATPVAWGIQLAKLWLASGQGFPVRVKDIALEVTKARFAEPVGCVIPHGIDGIDGMLSKRQKKNDWCISYDENVTIPGRINFTIAHELGHYLLHRKLRDTFQCGQVQILEYDSPESKRIESQANTFASYLLMPRTDFEVQIAGQPLSFDLLGHCADRYQTSLTATALKWLEFTSEAAMLVVADHDEFICWSFCSQAAKRIGAYKSPGEVVPPSVIEHLRSIAFAPGGTRSVAPGVWHATEDAIEAAIISDQFEQLIFLIRFPSAVGVNHADEPESDTFTDLMEKAQGFGWKR